jgi:hypothetical protein
VRQTGAAVGFPTYEWCEAAQLTIRRPTLDLGRVTANIDFWAFGS